MCYLYEVMGERVLELSPLELANHRRTSTSCFGEVITLDVIQECLQGKFDEALSYLSRAGHDVLRSRAVQRLIKKITLCKECKTNFLDISSTLVGCRVSREDEYCDQDEV